MLSNTLKQFRPMTTLYVSLGIVCALLSGLSVVFFQRLVDGLTAKASWSVLLPTLIAYGIMSLMVLLLYYLEEYPHNQLYHGLYQRIKQGMLVKVSTIDYQAYQEMGTGQLVQLMENGARAGRDILFEFYLRVFSRLLPGAVVSIVVMGLYDLRIMLGAVSGYVVVFLITKLLLVKLYSIKEKTLVSEEGLSRTYVRALMEFLVFRINRRFGHELGHARRLAKQVTDAHTRIKMVHEFFFASFAVLVLGIKLILIVASVPDVLAGEMNVGVLLALLTLVDRVYEPVAIFNVIYVDYKLDRITWGRMMGFMQAKDDPNLLEGKAFHMASGQVCFDSVSFAYDNAEVLRGVTLDIAPGETVALVGKSGGGKSTLIRLVLGLLKPTTGRVIVDGQNLSDMALNSYYQHIAYVAQDPPVFDGTVRENICFEQPATDAELMEILQWAHLEEWMSTLAHGLDTQVGEHGVKLSGGEKQRLAFARVLYQRPALVILDEPTSALDQETEAAVMDTIRTRLTETTVLYIAHRLSTVRHADRIVVLDGGSIVEMGTHEELILRQGVYASLVQSGP